METVFYRYLCPQNTGEVLLRLANKGVQYIDTKDFLQVYQDAFDLAAPRLTAFGYGNTPAHAKGTTPTANSREHDRAYKERKATNGKMVLYWLNGALTVIKTGKQVMAECQLAE